MELTQEPSTTTKERSSSIDGGGDLMMSHKDEGFPRGHNHCYTSCFWSFALQSHLPQLAFWYLCSFLLLLLLLLILY